MASERIESAIIFFSFEIGQDAASRPPVARFDDFHRYGAQDRLDLLGLIHHSHAALADLPDQPVGPDQRSGCGSRHLN
jgi:hypothetical protein